MTRTYCTYFDSNYLIKGLALIESLNRCETSPFRLIVVCLDDLTLKLLSLLACPNVALVSLQEIEESDEALAQARGNRNRVEYFWTLTPTVIMRVLYSMDPGSEVTYLDADLFFYTSPEPIFQEFSGHSVLIHEHRFSPLQKHLEVNGIYNVGLLCFRHDAHGREVLEWWRDRCNEWCYNRIEDGKFGDQLYLNDWPERFRGIRVLEHLGAGVAPWNHDQYAYSLSPGGNPLVNGLPLIFYHFHSFVFVAPDIAVPDKLVGYPLPEQVLHLCLVPYLGALQRAIAAIRQIEPNFNAGLRDKIEVTLQHTVVARKELADTLRAAGFSHRLLHLDSEWDCYCSAQVINQSLIAPPSSSEPPRQPLISVLVTTYASESFMRECLEDLERQTIFDQMEIVVVDAASPENEEAIIREFQQKHDNIIYIRTAERIGIYAAWNVAIKNSTGKYLFSFSTNDRLRPEACELLKNALEERPDIYLVYGDSYLTGLPHQTFENHTRSGEFIWPDYSFDFLLSHCSIGPHPMWRRSVHEALGFFDERFQAIGDQDMWLRMAEQFNLLHIPEITGLYWDSEQGISNQKSITVFEIAAIRVKYVRRYLERCGFKAEELERKLCSMIPAETSFLEQFGSKITEAADDTSATRPLVSAIVSTYNAERFIRQKLEDLEAQTVADRLEIVVVDSGSKQNERTAVFDFMKHSTNILYLRTGQRETVYQAWNRGIRAARGEFITNANTDDRLRRDAIEMLVGALQLNPEKMLAYGDSIVTLHENESFADCTPHDYLRWPDFDHSKLLDFCYVGPHPVWRRALHDELGYFDERYQCAADYEFWLRAAERYDFIHIPELLGLYWLNEGTVSRKGDLPLREAAQIQAEYRGRFQKKPNRADDGQFVRHHLQQQHGSPKALSILLVVHNFPPQNFAGVEIYTLNLAHELSAQGHIVTVLYSHPGNSASCYCEPDNYKGISIVRMHVPHGSLIQSVSSPEIDAVFAGFLKDHVFDVVHFQHICDNLSITMILAARQSGVTVALTLHDFWFICPRINLYRDISLPICSGPESPEKCVQCICSSKMYASMDTEQLLTFMTCRQKLVSSLFKEVDQLFAPSYFVADIYKRHGYGEGSIRIAPLGLPKLTVSHSAPGLLLRFGYLGTIQPIKNVQSLLRAFSATSGPARLDMYGRGDADYLKDLQRHSHDDRITWYGRYSPEQLPEILSRIDVLVVPSLTETYCLSLREALSVGIPVLASAVGGIPEIVRNGVNGFLFDPHDLLSLTNLMQQMMNSRDMFTRLTASSVHITTIAEDAEFLVQEYRSLLTGTVSTCLKQQADQADKQTIQVSIIIPVYNQVSYTRQCIDALFKTLPESLRCEIIIVNNASTDETDSYLLTLPPEVCIIRNRQNLGFAVACNQGSRMACGRLLLFLNNDTIPKPGWLEPLVTAVDSGEADICGARLLYPDGTCQHAGIAFSERGLYNIFSGMPSDAPAVAQRRYMQAVTGACLILRREVFHKLNGFDEGFLNGFEDVDLCIKAGSLGLRILYVPESVVIHYAEQSSGRKDHDHSNAARFQERWGGRIECDDQSLYASFGLSGSYSGDGTLVVSPMVDFAPIKASTGGTIGHGNRYPLIPLVGQPASSVLQKLSSSSRLKQVLRNYTTEN